VELLTSDCKEKSGKLNSITKNGMNQDRFHAKEVELNHTNLLRILERLKSLRRHKDGTKP